MWLGLTPPTVRRRRLRLAARAHALAMEAPTARASRLAFVSEGSARQGRLALSPAVTAKRRSPLAFSSRGLGRPFALRTLFESANAAPPFGAAVPDIVAMLAAPTLAEAAIVADGLRERSWSDEQARVVEAIRALALGLEAPASLWGEDAAADALRLRLLRSAQRPRPGAIPWGFFLKWAGARLDVPALARLPPSLAGAATAALAAARGHRGAFQVLALRAPERLHGAFAAPLSLVALRCALDGLDLPAFAALLLPPPRRRPREATARDPWSAALLALRAYREHGNVAGLAHLTAALTAADLRERVLLFAERDAAALLRRRWWSSPPAQAQHAVAAGLGLLRSKAHLVTGFSLTPWPRGWGGPAFADVVHALQGFLGRMSGTLALEVLLDDRLAVAAFFGAIGSVLSAEAQLAQAEVPPALAEARQALEKALARAPAVDDPFLVLKERPWGPEAERVYQRLRATPEPSLELGSPHWMLGETRGAVMSRLVAQGRSDAARAVRPVLDRADLRRDLEPFWLLRGSEQDTAAVEGLATWLAGRERAGLDETEWTRFAEDACRRLQRQDEAGP